MSYMVEYEGVKFDEFEFRKDLPSIIHCLTINEANESEVYIQQCLLDWEEKYSEEIIDKVKESLDDFVNNFCDAFLDI